MIDPLDDHIQELERAAERSMAWVRYWRVRSPYDTLRAGALEGLSPAGMRLAQDRGLACYPYF